MRLAAAIGLQPLAAPCMAMVWWECPRPQLLRSWRRDCCMADLVGAPCAPPHSSLQVHRSRFQLTCQVCKQRHGACTQCCDSKCCAGFHPLCARQAGHRMEVGWAGLG